MNEPIIVKDYRQPVRFEYGGKVLEVRLSQGEGIVVQVVGPVFDSLQIQPRGPREVVLF